MASDLFDKTPYRVLGLAQDAKSSEANAAYARARRGGGDARRMNEARDTLSRFAPRLALDALVLAPTLSATMLDALTRPLEEDPSTPVLDAIECLVVLPELPAAAPAARLSLAPRRELAESVPVLTLEIDR